MLVNKIILFNKNFYFDYRNTSSFPRSDISACYQERTFSPFYSTPLSHLQPTPQPASQTKSALQLCLCLGYVRLFQRRRPRCLIRVVAARVRFLGFFHTGISNFDSLVHQHQLAPVWQFEQYNVRTVYLLDYYRILQYVVHATSVLRLIQLSGNQETF